MPTFVRRRLLQAGAISSLTSLLPLMPATAAWEKDAPLDADVIVVGSGAGGFTAAIRAAENGARVLLLEANTWLGGASRVATGIFGCAGHPIQQKLGIKTMPEDLYQLYIGTAAATNTQADPAAARILADGAIGAADWLASLGVRWSTKKAQPFFLNIEEGFRLGQLLIPSLEKRARELKVTMKTQHRATALLTTDGRVSGVKVQTSDGERNFRARAVVLATGGFEANPEMIARYIGNDWDKAGVYCTPMNRGDGQRMAEAIGAELADMSVFKANPTIHLVNGNKVNFIAAVRAGAIAVNTRGERFMNEAGGYSQSLKIWAQPERKVFLIFGEPALKADHRFSELLARGSIQEAADLPHLAQQLGIPAATLATTVESTVRAVADKTPDPFGRKGLVNGFGGKFYAARIEPMMQGTFGGVRTNTRTEALRASGEVIPGLFAVGECAAAGLRGVNPQTANVVFGSIAGRESAKFALKA